MTWLSLKRIFLRFTQSLGYDFFPTPQDNYLSKDEMLAALQEVGVLNGIRARHVGECFRLGAVLLLVIMGWVISTTPPRANDRLTLHFKGRFLEAEFRKADRDGDGRISLQDFISWWEGLC